jgi:hypothetical protein
MKVASEKMLDGSVIKTKTMKDGSVVTERYEGKFLIDYPNGDPAIQAFEANGNLYRSVSFEKPDAKGFRESIEKTFYSSGKLFRKMKATYSKNRFYKYLDFEGYFENGQIKCLCEHVVLSNKESKLTKQTFYYENGAVSCYKEFFNPYDLCNPSKDISYDESGNITQSYIETWDDNECNTVGIYNEGITKNIRKFILVENEWKKVEDRLYQNDVLQHEIIYKVDPFGNFYQAKTTHYCDELGVQITDVEYRGDGKYTTKVFKKDNLYYLYSFERHSENSYYQIERTGESDEYVSEIEQLSRVKIRFNKPDFRYNVTRINGKPVFISKTNKNKHYGYTDTDDGHMQLTTKTSDNKRVSISEKFVGNKISKKEISISTTDEDYTEMFHVIYTYDENGKQTVQYSENIKRKL